MFRTLAVLLALAFVALAVLFLVARAFPKGPVGIDRLWDRFGPADQGPVDFTRLVRRSTPNDALACLRAGQRISIGTRTPPSHVVAFSPRYGVVPASGNQETIAPLSAVKTTMVLSAMRRSSSFFKIRPTC